MSTILLHLAMYAFPPLALLFFYSFKNKRLIWLAIPASLIMFLLSCGKALADLEFLAMMFIPLALHTIAVSVVTALAASLKSKAEKQPKKRTLIIIAAVICAIALGFVAHTVLAETSDKYAQRLDQPIFTQLTQIQPEDVASIEVMDPGEKFGRTAKAVDYHGDMTFFADLEYIGSELSGITMHYLEGIHTFSVSIVLRDGNFAHFIQYEDDIFEARYNDRRFYVKSPQLLADVT